MAIEIVPKKVVKPSRWQKILLYVLIILLSITILGYLVLNFYFIKKANQKLSELENQVKLEKGHEYITLETQLKEYQKKIEDFSQLLSKHKKSSNFFTFIEQNTHSKVFFSEVGLDTIHNQAKLSGKTESFKTLGEQLIILKDTKFITDIKLSDIKIKKEGEIGFSFIISLNPSLFK